MALARPVYLQCALFGVSAAQDLLLKRPTSHATYAHLRKAIKVLNCNLSSTNRAVSLRDGVILAAVTTIFACRMGDHQSARAHAAGRKQMVRLRGGMQAFEEYVALLYEQDSGLEWLSSSPAELCDGRLWDILRDMRSYVSFIQDGSTTKDRRPEEEFHTTFCCLQHGLLTLNISLLDATSQSIRLALIAVLTTVFQFPGLRASFPYLTNQYQERYPVAEGDGSGNVKRLVTWYLIVGIMAVAEAGSGEEWMFERWREDVGVVSWEEARKRCKEVLWIDALHDGVGKTAFDRLKSRM
ncbi:hypothetical protein S7711_01635 [Stachybotrys chartarum IBT 7711]|uniref:Transcription factor domain-containing protein n=1 Tax=Stachybotrys chartarum (strain CBS 109288 / IBT 7711) TaxID=1280523 RepID=A0A084BCB6_STACB|nr:hypothetical protein S7711_01635 [Stachybotrys chartarum IBT 7711]